MLINRNTLGHVEEATFILVKASEERVGVLQCTSKKWEHKFNDLDTISFELPYLTDNEKTPYYDLIDVMKHVEVPEISARFTIKDVEIINEGQKTEYKSVSCQSYECQLGQRYLEEFAVNVGTTGSIDGVSFYSPGDQTHSLLHLAIAEKAPEWSFGHISNSLRTMKRSFEVSRQDIYAFLMEDVAQAFECVFTFDTLNKEINAYTVEEYGIDTNVHISYNNLLEKAELSYSIDEIKTCLALSGSDNLNVREINRGFDRIYNFSFWADEEYWSQSLLNAYNAWNTLIQSPVNLNLFTYKTGVITRAELQGKNYDQAYAVLLTKYQNYYTEISKWSTTLMPYGINTRNNPGYGTISYTEDGSDAVTFTKQTSTQLVKSLPSSGNVDVLYLIEKTNNMYRWNGKWVDVNKWYNCNRTTLKEKLAAAEKIQAVAMKAGYGDSASADTTIQQRYIDTYLPSLYMYNALNAQISTVSTTISNLEADQAIIQNDKTVIINKTSMQNNFTQAQLKELSAFIREEELSSDNYLVTDNMTEDERFDMLYDLLEYGQKELAKIASPQIQFSVDMENLFAIPEFDVYSGSFDLGNYVWVTLRDDYSIKAKILEVDLDFLDQSQFTVTFGNIMRKARNIFTDVTDALNAATSAATSVSMNASYWSASAEETDSIGQALASGLLSQQYYLANAEDNETLIDENGVWITTVTGKNGRQSTSNYDAIYLGGGRILFTDDGWRSVSMSVGRAEVDMPTIYNGQLVFKKESLFGTFADFLIAGYVGGSIIVGGDIYSANYKTSTNKNSGNAGTHINLTDGTFEFNDKTAGRKRLFFNGDTLEVNGIINAREGHIGSDVNGDGGFIIANKKFYMAKTSFNDKDHNGIYIGFDSNSPLTEGISLGAYNTSTGRNPFSVNVNGYLTSTSGYIGGFNITDKTLYYNKNSYNSTSSGLYIGFDGSDNATKGIFLGAYNASTGKNPFSVNVDGYLVSTSGNIGGFSITNNSIYNNEKNGLYVAAPGVYIGTDGIALHNDNRFIVDVNRGTAKIAGFDFNSNYMSTGGKTGLYDTDHQGVYVGSLGISLGNTIRDGEVTITNPFYVTNDGSLYAKYGEIGDIYLRNNGLSAKNSKWWIHSDGEASFSNVHISGVQWGSSFGDLNFDNGITWGSFRGASTYGSNAVEPFKGNCVTHIESISADYINTNYLTAMRADITNLNTAVANIDTLVATKASITDLNAVKATVDTISADYVKASQITTYTLSATQIRWNGNDVTSASGYVATNYPSGSVNVKGISYEVHLAGFTKMNIMGYWSG